MYWLPNFTRHPCLLLLCVLTTSVLFLSLVSRGALFTHILDPTGVARVEQRQIPRVVNSYGRDMEGHQEPNVPIVQLFVRASPLDKRNIGANPLDQQYFMAYSLLDQQQYLILKEVITITVESPPADFLDLNVGMNLLPVLKVLSGIDPKRATDIAGQTIATDDDLEQFLSRFGSPDLQPRSKEEDRAEQSFRHLYSKLNVFLKSKDADSTRLHNELSRLNSYLDQNGARFAISDNMSYADCMLMPKLHHVRVAAKAFKNYDIPPTLTSLWQYLANAYSSDIFTQSCPADQDIIYSYMSKVSTKPIGGDPMTQRQRTFQFTVPSGISVNN